MLIFLFELYELEGDNWSFACDRRIVLQHECATSEMCFMTTNNNALYILGVLTENFAF